MNFYSYLRKRNNGVLMEGFELLQNEFMLFIASDRKKIYLDGSVRMESFASVRLPILSEDGIRICKEPIFQFYVETYGLYDWPFFILVNNLYAASSFPKN